MGEFAAWAPASLMRDLPFFSSFRIPSRHILLVPLVGAICMGSVAGRLLSARSAARRVIDILCVVGVCQLILVNRDQLRDVFVLPPDAAASRLFEQQTPTIAAGDVPRLGGPERVLSTNMLGSMLVGVSPLNCWEPLQLKKVAALGPAGLHAEGAVTLTDSTFSPNRVAATVTVGTEPVRLGAEPELRGWLVNQSRPGRARSGARPSLDRGAGRLHGHGRVQFLSAGPVGRLDDLGIRGRSVGSRLAPSW